MKTENYRDVDHPSPSGSDIADSCDKIGITAIFRLQGIFKSAIKFLWLVFWSKWPVTLDGKLPIMECWPSSPVLFCCSPSDVLKPSEFRVGNCPINCPSSIYWFYCSSNVSFFNFWLTLIILHHQPTQTHHRHNQTFAQKQSHLISRFLTRPICQRDQSAKQLI